MLRSFHNVSSLCVLISRFFIPNFCSIVFSTLVYVYFVTGNCLFKCTKYIILRYLHIFPVPLILVLFYRNGTLIFRIDWLIDFILLQFHCVLIGAPIIRCFLSKSSFHMLRSFHNVSSRCVLSSRFFIPNVCSIVFYTLVMMLHIRLLCANKYFLLTYLLTYLCNSHMNNFAGVIITSVLRSILM